MYTYDILYTYSAVILYGHFVLIYFTVVLAVLGLRYGELLLLYIRIGHGTANLVYIIYYNIHTSVCVVILGATGAKRRQLSRVPIFCYSANYR